jgi:RNA polymerase sigma-70 factor (ECF subfamily)
MELLERFAAGDLDAFETLFHQYQREVYRWIVRIVRNSATAEDLTVETFWRMYRAHARYDATMGSCGAWLRRIATNAAIDHLRHARNEIPLMHDPADAALRPPSEQHELRREIRGAMNKLSPRLRVVVLLALVEEEPYAKIAQSLGITEDAVKLRVFRAVRILRKTLSKAGVHP